MIFPAMTVAIAVDLAMLSAMLGRITEFGFVRGRTPFARLERWQTGYLPVYAAWAAVVVAAFPPLFGFA